MTERNLSRSTPEAEGLSADALAAVDAAVQQQIDGGVLAGAVTMTARHGRVVRTTAAGMADIASGTPMALDTMFRIFSMTKPVTAVAMCMLLDEGLWTLDAPIATYLPEVAGIRVARGTDDDGAPLLDDAAHAPTMSELMTHTAGFTYGWDPQSAVDRQYAEARVMQAPTLAEMVRRVASAPLAYQPGTQWLYSLSVDLQGAIVERLSGMTLPDFFEQRIFAPLGMRDTAFFTPPDKAGRLATLYSPGDDGALAPITNPLLPDFDTVPSAAAGGAGLVSTIGDYARFCQLLLNGGEFEGRRIVSAPALATMMRNHVSDAIVAGGFGVGQQRIRPGTGFGFDGLVFTDPALAGIPVGRGTYQWDGAAGTWFWVDPEHDLFFIGMIQLMSATAPPLQSTTQTLMADAIQVSPDQ